MGRSELLGSHARSPSVVAESRSARCALATGPAPPSPGALPWLLKPCIHDREKVKVGGSAGARPARDPGAGSGGHVRRASPFAIEPGRRARPMRSAIPKTPWGPLESRQLLGLDGSLTADGRPRTLLDVFSHGWPHKAIDHSAHRRVVWVPREAGLRRILADITCGSLNTTLAPRDLPSRATSSASRRRLARRRSARRTGRARPDGAGKLRPASSGRPMMRDATTRSGGAGDGGRFMT